MAAEHEVGLDPLLPRDKAQLLEAGDLRLGEGLVGEVCERGAAPKAERLGERRRGALRVSTRELAAAPGDQALEAAGVDLVVLELEDIAGARATSNWRRPPAAPNAFRRLET